MHGRLRVTRGAGIPAFRLLSPPGAIATDIVAHMPALYVRISEETYGYLKRASAQAGISMAEATEAIVDIARRGHWRLEQGSAPSAPTVILPPVPPQPTGGES